MKRSGVLRLSFVVSFVTALANAQVAGTVAGVVLDSSSAGVPNATVSLRTPGISAATYVAVTTASGDF